MNAIGRVRRGLVSLCLCAPAWGTAAPALRSLKSTITLPIIVCISALAALSSGCATIVKGSTQDVPISSTPAGAHVTVDGRSAGTTPTTVAMDRQLYHMVTVELENFEMEHVVITNSIGGAVAGNIIGLGLLGGALDVASGAAYDLNPDSVTLLLRAKTSSAVASAPAKTARLERLSGELAKLDALKSTEKFSAREYENLRALLAAYQVDAATETKTTR